MKIPIKLESGAIGVGDHDVGIVEVVPGTNSKGNPNLRTVFETPDGAQIADWITILPQTQWRLRQLWEAAGLEFPNDGGEIDTDDLIGRQVHIVVEEDTYQGTTRDKVTDISAPVEPDIPIDGSDLPEPGAAAAAKDTFAAAAGLEDDEELPY